MRTLLTLGCLAVLGGCAIIVAPNDDVQLRTVFDSKTVTGDGRLSHETRAVGNLPGLEVSGPLQVDVRVGVAPSLAIEADSNLLPLIRSEASGNTMRIWIDGNIRTEHPMRVTYTVPQLTQLRATGSGRTTVSELNGAPLVFSKTGSGSAQLSGRVASLEMEQTGSGQVDGAALQSGTARLTQTGSGRMNLGQLHGDAATISLRGSGELQVGGAVRSLNVQVHGSGGANLMNLSSEQADLASSGSGDISARVLKSVVAQASGSGRITVYGNPAQRTVSGKHVEVLN